MRYNPRRAAADKAAVMRYTGRNFSKVLRKMEYVAEMNENRKCPTIRSVNSKMAPRIYRRGEEYTPELIKATPHNHYAVLPKAPKCSLYGGRRLVPAL